MKTVSSLRAALGVLAALVAGGAQAQAAGINQYACGPLQNAFGPFDYRTISFELRHRVEDHHFTPQVEQIRAGQEGYIGSDIDYTLRTMPNNAHALMAVTRYAKIKHSTQMQGARYTSECYFERAIRFVPDDPMPHLIYAVFLWDLGRKSEVKPQLDLAEKLRGTPAGFDFDYNLGILYFDVGAYDQSLAAAKRAYALGAPLPALMKKLKGAGRWRDDPPASAAAASQSTPQPTPQSTPQPTSPSAPAGEPVDQAREPK